MDTLVQPSKLSVMPVPVFQLIHQDQLSQLIIQEAVDTQAVLTLNILQDPELNMLPVTLAQLLHHTPFQQ